MSDLAIRLFISRTVYGRETDGKRVTYLVNPSPAPGKREIPATVVLKRWQQRTLAGYRLEGSRLPLSSRR